MTISYNWLSEYLPEKIEPEKLSKILTSIGLEVESLEEYESIKGGLKGLITGQVMETLVNISNDKPSVSSISIKIRSGCCCCNKITEATTLLQMPDTSIFSFNCNNAFCNFSAAGFSSSMMITFIYQINYSIFNKGNKTVNALFTSCTIISFPVISLYRSARFCKPIFELGFLSVFFSCLSLCDKR